MLKMIKGCKISESQKLQEEYEVCEFVINANVNADKIEEVLQHFIEMQKSLLFFILELPSNENDENNYL